eukprot:NODE_1976_length_1730_cov_50.573740_g1685_i0.p1 GENE.NODE_1976_length_1730_cov_50.573740_g1685_i0~~NODE_1976_length_1730_cov_50.573740_g1685_i0.p1  ORF type:complete len:550 (+),score=86.65 NODE_1976_length_1730_cov_50.573740_g1685_i0:51-1700(+)
MYSFWIFLFIMESILVDCSIITCDICKEVVDIITKAADNLIGIDTAEGLAYDICVKYNIEKEDVCKGIVHEFAPEIIYIAAHLSSEERKEICSKIELCPKSGRFNIFGKRQPLPKMPEKLGPRSKSLNVVGKFAHVTDVHVDGKYTQGSTIDCGRPLCCHGEYGPAPSPQLAAGKFGTLDGPCDLAPETFDALVKSVATHIPDFVLLTGDYPPHNVWEQSQDHNVGYLELVSTAFGASIKNPTFPCLGNHEAFPVNQYRGPGYDSWLYNASASMWAQWLPQSALTELRYGGYYSTIIHPGLRLIALNSLLWMPYSNNYWQLLPESKIWQQEMLVWLDKTLSLAYNSSEKVYITTHLPWDTVINEYAETFAELLQHYQGVVLAIFGGHSHSDYWKVFKANDTNLPYAIHYSGPSGTTATGLHPTYRIFYYDTTTFELLDIETYFGNITESNLKGSIQFELAYNTRMLYNMKGLKPSDWQAVNDLLSKNDTLFNQYFKNFNQQQVAPPGPTRTCDSACKKSQLCTLNTISSSQYKECMGDTPIPVKELHRD